MRPAIEDHVIAGRQDVARRDFVERAGHMRRQPADRAAFLDLGRVRGAEGESRHDRRERSG